MSIFFVAAHAMVTDDSNRVLVLKRSLKNDYMPLKWDFPGGTVETGEKVEDALVRELREETAITVDVLHPLYVYSNLSQLPRRQTVQIVFLCKYKSGDVVLNPDEHDDFKWVDMSELFDLDCIAYLEDFINNSTSVKR